MGRIGLTVPLTPLSPTSHLPLPTEEAWEEAQMDLWREVHETLAARMPDGPEAATLELLDAACLMESGCTPGELSVDARDDQVVTAHAGVHWYSIGLSLLAESATARLAELGYRLTTPLTAPELLAAAPVGESLVAVDGLLVLVNSANGEVSVDDGEEEVDEETAAALLATAAADPRCGCRLCHDIRAATSAR